MSRDQDGVTIGIAARLLGISENAVRKRIRRGSLEATKDQAGQWRVIVGDQAEEEAAGDSRDQATTSEADMSLQIELERVKAERDAIREERDWLRERVDRAEHLQAGLIERLPKELTTGVQPKEAEQPVETRRWWEFWK